MSVQLIMGFTIKAGMEKVIKHYLTKLAERDILTILCTFATIGIIGLIYDLYLLRKRKVFGEKYLSKHEQWVSIRSSDEESDEPLRRWLQRNLTRMKNEIEGTGRIYFFGSQSPSEKQAILERYIGELDDRISCELWGLINPLVWLTRSVRWILIDSPFWLLRSVGLINVNRVNNIRNHSLSDKFVGTITLLGSLFSLIAGWDSVVKFFRQILGWLSFIDLN